MPTASAARVFGLRLVGQLRDYVRALDWRHPQRRMIPLGIGVVTSLAVTIGLVWLFV